MTNLSKLLTFVYLGAIILIILLNLLPQEFLLDNLEINFQEETAPVLFYTSTTLAAGYFSSLFILSFYANFRNKHGNFNYLMFMKLVTATIFILSGLFSTYVLILFGALDMLLAGLYFTQARSTDGS